jgi:hypothetical protein
MSDEYDEKAPGVTLFFETGSIFSVGTQGDTMYRMRVGLVAEVRDEELWKEVETKLKDPTGFRIFTSEDFHGAVMDAMRAKLHELEGKNNDLARKLRQETDARTRAEQEVEQYKGPLAKLGRVLSSR